MTESYWNDWQQTRSDQKLQVSLKLCGHQVLTMVSRRVTKDVVTPLLPDGARLGPPGPDGRYILLYTFAYQQFVRPAWIPAILSVSYLECIVAVEGVQLPVRQGHLLGPVSLPGKLYCDSFLAWSLGRFIGYRKLLSRMKTSESSYLVRTLSGRPVLSASFQTNGTVENPFYGSAYSQFRDFSCSPGLTKTPFGTFLCSILDFDRGAALAQPVIAEVEVRTPDFPGLPPGTHHFHGTDAEPLFAMRLHVPWTMRLQRADSLAGEAPPAQGTTSA